MRGPLLLRAPGCSWRRSAGSWAHRGWHSLAAVLLGYVAWSVGAAFRPYSATELGLAALHGVGSLIWPGGGVRSLFSLLISHMDSRSPPAVASSFLPAFPHSSSIFLMREN